MKELPRFSFLLIAFTEWLLVLVSLIRHKVILKTCARTQKTKKKQTHTPFILHSIFINLQYMYIDVKSFQYLVLKGITFLFIVFFFFFWRNINSCVDVINPYGISTIIHISFFILFLSMFKHTCSLYCNYFISI